MTVASGSKKKIAFLVVLVVLTALIIAGWLVMQKAPVNKAVTSGDRAPEFRLKTIEGGTVSLADLRGKVVMVHFWATWCPPCVEEMPTLEKLNRALAGRDLVMLAVNEDEGGAGAVAAFIRQNNLNVPVLLDPNGEIARLYGTYKLPETYIVDRQGVVRYKAIGPRDWTDPSTVQLLQNIVEAR